MHHLPDRGYHAVPDSLGLVTTVDDTTLPVISPLTCLIGPVGDSGRSSSTAVTHPKHDVDSDAIVNRNTAYDRAQQVVETALSER